MKNFAWFIIAACLSGCFSIHQIPESETPQLLYQTPLPPLPESIQKLPSEISLAIYVLENGAVDNVRLSKSSGSDKWDSLAVRSIRQWRFNPAKTNQKPFSTWFHMRAPLRYTAPLPMTLAEIKCSSKDIADTIYEALGEGQEFSALVRKYSIDDSKEKNGVIGEVDIYCYPENIRGTLKSLDIGEYTAPLPYGDAYVIFKRIKKAE